MMTQSERRVCERVRYPQELRPTILINGQESPLVEISEAGLVFASHDERYRVCRPFSARIVFFDRGAVEVRTDTQNAPDLSHQVVIDKNDPVAFFDGVVVDGVGVESRSVDVRAGDLSDKPGRVRSHDPFSQ